MRKGQLGIGLVAITYDTPEAQQPFIEQHGITVPLLSDIEQGTFRAPGLSAPFG